MTRRSPYSRRATARPRRLGYGPTCATTAAPAIRTPTAVWFAYTPDRKGIHPKTHLVNFKGVLQADAYAGFNALYADGSIQEAACWAHARRKFYDLHAARPSPLTTEALRRIAKLYVIEAEIRGKPPDERLRTHARPLLDDLERWLRASLKKLSRKKNHGGGLAGLSRGIQPVRSIPRASCLG